MVINTRNVWGYIVTTFMQQNVLASNHLKSLFSLLKRREFVQSETSNLDKYGAVRSTVVDVSKKDFFHQFTPLFPLKVFVSTSCSPVTFFSEVSSDKSLWDCCKLWLSARYNKFFSGKGTKSTLLSRALLLLFCNHEMKAWHLFLNNERNKMKASENVDQFFRFGMIKSFFWVRS